MSPHTERRVLAGTEADRAQAAELVALATSELRRIYRPRAAGTKRTAPPLPFLVAREGDTAVGVLEYEERPEGIHLQGLAVLPQARRRGVARSLIDALAELARERGKARLTLAAIKETGNPALFARMGFQIEHEAPAEGYCAPDGACVIRVDMYRLL